MKIDTTRERILEIALKEALEMLYDDWPYEHEKIVRLRNILEKSKEEDNNGG